MSHPDDLTPMTDVVSRVDAVALQQLTLLESTIHALRPRLNDEALDIDDVITLSGQIGALSHLMLQWADLLMERSPANEEETTCPECGEEAEC